METWRTIIGFPFYDVSDQGRVRSWVSGSAQRRRRRDTPRILARRLDNKGYDRANLGSACERFVHQLVLESFVGPRPTAKHEGRHLNGIRDDNSAINLEWAGHAENMHDQYKHGTRARGATHGMVKLTLDDVLAIRESTGPLGPIAERYGVTKPTICNIRNGKAWKHLQCA